MPQNSVENKFQNRTIPSWALLMALFRKSGCLKLPLASIYHEFGQRVSIWQNPPDLSSQDFGKVSFLKTVLIGLGLSAGASIFISELPLHQSASIAMAQSSNSSNISIDKKSSVSMFESLTIAPSATPQKFLLHGISGGPAMSQSVTLRPKTETGECIGFVDRQPDHRLTLTQPLQYLQLLVRSPGDTVLIVRGPGGVWCNDDSANRNPAIAGRWLAGTYDIWIGSYEEFTSFPYLLELSTETSILPRRSSSTTGRNSSNK
ncbi:MAG: hypothetical protein WCO45_03530 [Pseudanabaena sp. ELA607]